MNLYMTESKWLELPGDSLSLNEAESRLFFLYFTFIYGDFLSHVTAFL